MHACADSLASNTLAATTASSNFASNGAALATSQPALVIGDPPNDVEWVFGRDRALTYRDANGTWLTDCSLPRRAATEMLRRLDATGPVACFLAPTHAAQIRVALDRLNPEQAIILLVPSSDSLATILACESFQADITRNRLWIVAGTEWARDLKQLFTDRPGLCTPTQFIRLPIIDESIVEQLIPAAQKIFTEANADRAASLRNIRESYTRRSDRICVAAPSLFRLWDDSGNALASLFDGSDAVRIDLDDPSQASALALAEQSSECGAVITANLARTDLPNVLSESIRWITWASDTRIPSARGACDHDRIITAHPKLAYSAGWKAHQIVEATWPAACGSAMRDAKPQAASLAIVADTHPLDTPDDLSEFSSHRVLWEMISSELRNDPFILTDHLDGFLTNRMRKLEIAGENLSPARFINQLIIPAYQQSLARLLIKNQIPVALHGKGWDRIPEFAVNSRGIVASREHLRDIASEHSALIHLWPNLGPHAIDSLGISVLRRRSNIDSTFISDAKAILTGRAISAPFSAPKLSREMIANLAA